MPAAPPVSTATKLPWRLADSKAKLPLQTQVCTADNTLPGPGMPATQGGLRGQFTPSQLDLLWVGSDPITANHMVQVLDFR